MMRGKQISGFASREKVLQDLFAVWEPVISEETVPLDQAAGRVMARTLYSRNTLPVCRTSGCDGIAVRAADFAGGMPDYMNWTEGREFFRADTGDDFPDGYDAVIMIEEVDLDESGRILYISDDITVKEGDHVTPAGSQLREGDALLNEGLRIRPTDLAVLAAGGYPEVPVRKKPVVAFIPTGSELIPATERPSRGKNIEANSYLTAAALRELGAEPMLFPIIPDDKEKLNDALDKALAAADIVLICGGTAKGSEDYNYSLLSQGTLLNHYVAAAPGRPLATAVLNGKPVLNVPGPPGASFYTMEWCVRPVICRALGMAAIQRVKLDCELAAPIRSTPQMAILMRLNVYRRGDDYVAVPLRGRAEPMSVTMTSNAMYVSDLGESSLEAGTRIEVELLRDLSEIPEMPEEQDRY